MIDGNEIVRRIQRGEKNENLPHQLLREFFRGYPIAELPKLFDNPNAEVVKTAAWIASELGTKGSPILSATARLLSHPSKYVRFFAIDSVLACATVRDAAIIADVVRLLRDPEPSVRWKVMDFLSRVALDRLEATANLPLGAETPSEIVKRILHLALPTTSNVSAIISHLNSNSKLERQEGAVAAARVSRQDPLALKEALSNRDEDVRNFAQSFHGTK